MAVRSRHLPGEKLPRHRHAAPYAAVVLSGSYVEAGDFGRHRVNAGDVVVHQPFEGHLNSFGAVNAEVLNLPLPLGRARSAVARLDDVDQVASLAECDVTAAAELLLGSMTVRTCSPEDWPDQLAADLLQDPGLSLAEWAVKANLHPGSLSRAFRQEFAITPAQFRLIARSRVAFGKLGLMSLSDIAALAGFADQAHMTRALTRMTGMPPARLRASLTATGSGSAAAKQA